MQDPVGIPLMESYIALQEHERHQPLARSGGAWRGRGTVYDAILESGNRNAKRGKERRSSSGAAPMSTARTTTRHSESSTCRQRGCVLSCGTELVGLASGDTTTHRGDTTTPSACIAHSMSACAGALFTQTLDFDLALPAPALAFIIPPRFSTLMAPTERASKLASVDDRARRMRHSLHHRSHLSSLAAPQPRAATACRDGR